MPYPLHFSRNRSRQSVLQNITFNVPGTSSWLGYCPPYGVHTPYSISRTYTLSETFADNKTPGFATKLKQGKVVRTLPVHSVKTQGWDLNTFLLVVTTAGNYCCSNVLKSYNHPRYYLNDFVMPSHGVSVWTLNSEVPHLLKRAIAQTRDAELDLLTTWGERKETISHLAGRLKDVGELTYKFRDKLRRMSRKESFHGAWLEYRYAIMPNVYTIQSLVKVLNTPNMTRAKGSDKTNGYSEFEDVVYSTTFGTSKVLAEVKARTSYEWTVRSYAMSQAVINSLGTHFKINPLTTALELMRLSFVAEWFIDLGDTLASYRMPWEAGIVDAGASVKLRRVTNLEYATNSGVPRSFTGFTCNGVTVNPWVQTYSGDVMLVTVDPFIQEEYLRYPLSSGDAAWWPTVKVSLNNQRLLDALALLRGALPRRR